MLLMQPFIADSSEFSLLVMPLVGDPVVILLHLWPLNAYSVPFLLLMPPYVPCIFLALSLHFVIFS